MKTTNTLIIALCVALLGWFLWSVDSADSVDGITSMTIPFPYTLSVAANTSFACEALLSGNIIGTEAEHLTKGIEGDIAHGTDKIAMRIKSPEILSFLTGATVGLGATEGDDWAIVENTKEKLMAVWFNENAISTVALNKNNGLAVWLKGNPDFPTYGAPHGSVIYMICR